MVSRRLALFSCVIVLATVAFIGCGGVPQVSVTTVPNGGPLSKVNDSLYEEVLRNVVSPNGAISLTRLRSDTALTEYLNEIARMRTDVFVSRPAALTFWINAHNAFVMDLLRSNGTPRSTDDISGFAYAHVLLVGGTMYSLNDIEHNILTKQFREPRAFFALWDGSRSSPRLASEAYNEEELSHELDTQLREFLEDSTKNMLDRHANTIYLSHLFRDYQDDIEAVTGSLTSFVRAFAPAPMVHWIDGHPNVVLSYLSYDQTVFTSDVEPPKKPRPEPRKPARRSTGGIQ
jgi:hypothetical protein